MIRIKPHKKPVAILCSDIHLRETQPACRLDDFVNVTQWRKVDFITELQRKHDCPVLHAGDLFDHWKPSPELISKAIEHLPNDFWTVYGQHDLPQHNLELKFKSGVFTLNRANKVRILPQGHWGVEPSNGNWTIGGRNIYVWHKMNYQGKKPWPDCTDPSAASLLRKYPQYDLILTGDNHKPFVETFEGRTLVNPGSLFRMDANQIDHCPRVYLWYAETNTVEPVYIPFENDIISREHIEVKEKRDARIEAFVGRLDSDWQVTMSFEQNLEAFKKKNNVRDKIMNIIYKAIEI